MLTLIIGAIAALAGVFAGMWLRSRDLRVAQAEIQRLQQESAARAGFEAVAAERASSLSQLTAERDGIRTELNSKLESERTLSARVSALEAELRGERESLAEKVTLLDAAKKSLADQFQALAADILDKKSKSFSEGTQKEIGTLLDPLKTQISEFRKKVEEAQSDSKTGVTKLETLIGVLAEQSKQMSEKADNLTTALRGSAKAQGDWGEFILRDLLEKAGLREGEQYTFQQSFEGIEDGDRTKTARTDVIINLPGGRNLVIDSKVSLVAYTDYVAAATDLDRTVALKQHLASVRGHVTNLSKAGYHRLPGIEAPDFVVLFVPIEPAFLLALQNDGALWTDAYERGILLVGPTTLLYIIRIVNVLWQQELQGKNVRDVMDRGARLYEKFVGFVVDLEDLGKSLSNASECYEDARRKLTSGDGNLIRQVEMLRQLGVKPRKTLPAKLLESVEMEEPTLALAAEAENGD
jgi:DNA recombination protein RmuC